MIIDNKLNWEPHVDHLTKKLNSSIVLIKRIIKFIPKSEYMTIYDALFKSHLSYCISSLGQYLTRSCKVCLIYRKDVFACYLVLSTHMTILGTMQRVYEHVPTNTTCHPKTTVLNTQNHCLININ